MAWYWAWYAVPELFVRKKTPAPPPSKSRSLWGRHRLVGKFAPNSLRVPSETDVQRCPKMSTAFKVLQGASRC